MAVKVKRERPDQRRHHRVTAPLFVDFGGWRLRAADWSLGGLRLEGFPDEVPSPGDALDLHLTLPFQGFDIAFDAKAEVVRSDAATGMFAVQFTEIGERERELMSHFIEELIRGSMVDIEETINRIDVPVTPASLKPDASPSDEVPVRRWPIKTLVMTAVYLVLGAIVFGYTAMLIYTNFFRLEVQTAVISSPVEEVRARADGRVVWQDVAPGAPVEKGQVLVSIMDTELEREIDLARIAVDQQRAKLLYLKRRYTEEQRRSKSFVEVEIKNVEQTRLAFEAAEAEVAAAILHRDRIAKLFRKGYATALQRDTAEKDVIRLRKRAEQARVEFRARAALAANNQGRQLFTGENVVGEIGEVEAQLKLAESEIELSKARHATLMRHRERLAVKAPFDGRLIRLMRPDNTQVRRGDPIAVVERPRAREVKAFLKQDEVNLVGLNDQVDVFVPSIGERLSGRVISIDRTAGFLCEQDARHNPGYTWRGPQDRSAEVVIKIKDRDGFQIAEVYKPGTPVVVVFPRNGGNEAVQSVTSTLLRGSTVQ